MLSGLVCCRRPLNCLSESVPRTKLFRNVRLIRPRDREVVVCSCAFEGLRNAVTQWDRFKGARGVVVANSRMELESTAKASESLRRTLVDAMAELDQ